MRLPVPHRPRAAAAAAAAAGTFAATVLLAVPAAACSCPPTVEETLASGGAIGIVTRTDRGETSVGTLRIIEAFGVDLPAQIVDDLEDDGDCTPNVPPGIVAVLAFERREHVWRVAGCSQLDLMTALHRLHGDPEAVEGGRPVAYAVGDYGGRTLAALDAFGRVVAWDHRRGSADRVAVCPGGEARPWSSSARRR